jgi:hypothetical protein
MSTNEKFWLLSCMLHLFGFWHAKEKSVLLLSLAAFVMSALFFVLGN